MIFEIDNHVDKLGDIIFGDHERHVSNTDKRQVK